MRSSPAGLAATFLALAIVAAACTGSTDETATGQTANDETTTDETAADGITTDDAAATDADGPDPEAGRPAGADRRFGPAPTVPTRALSAEVIDALDTLYGAFVVDAILTDPTRDAFDTIAASGDPRLAWLLTDNLRVTASTDVATAIGDAFAELTGVEIDPYREWTEAVDHLIAWDVPAPPDYLRHKRSIYLAVDERWAPLFAESSDVDWRFVSWGGVLMDDRAYDRTDTPCACIPAVDNPEVTDAAAGDEWLAADTIVFGVEIGGEARAYPRSVMEVREMVNDTLGGRDFAMPYCTLCGAAQVFFTDRVEGFDRPVLRTSGLLSRSNKVMFDIETSSVFDTFLGAAVTGPLWEAGVVLPQHTVVTTTWADWKAAHPDTSVVAVGEALGRPDSDLRNTRDADGPIFPIGGVDARLAVQEDVFGVVTDDGTPIAFHVSSALAALEQGETVRQGDVALVPAAGGLRAVDGDGDDLPGHQAFWFAWSQFHPDTDLWTP